MTDFSDPGTREAAQALAQEASTAAADAVERIALELGARVTPVPDSAAHPRSPADALRIARQLEYAARAEARVHVRRARESGLSWHEIGALLGFGSVDTGVAGPTVEQLAFDYAAGPRILLAWFPAPPVFRWDCPVCGQRVADRGPARGPRHDETGHTGGCERLAAAAVEWDADHS